LALVDMEFHKPPLIRLGLALLLGLLLALQPSGLRGEPVLEEPVLEVFVAAGCPHCAAAEAYLPQLHRRHPGLQVRIRHLGRDPEALADLERHSRRAGVGAPGVPTFVVGDAVLVGFDGPQRTGAQLQALIAEQRGRGALAVASPFGQLSVSRLGLPLFTLGIGLLDGFNPCAMWVLLFLLSLLVHWRDRRRMALVAGTFVLVSGLVYYAFLAAWLNVFLLLGVSRQLQIVLACLALAVGLVNLLDLRRRDGAYTLAIPAAAKPGLYARMRTVLQSRSLVSSLLAVAALAVVVNLVELLCTAGLPALYTAVLSQQQLSPQAYYGYLGLYIVGYIADDALMVGLAVWAMGSRRLGDHSARLLKLLSAVVMLALGLVMLLSPDWLI
jgi:glutaredoxin